MASPPALTTAETAARLLPAALAALPGPVAVVQATSHVLVVANGAWKRMADRFGAGAVGGSVDTLFPAAEQLMAETLLEAGPITRRAVPASVTASGAATWWDLELVPHPDEGGFVIFVAREATAAVLADRDADETSKALSATDARLIIAEEATGIGIWEWNFETDTQAWSAAQFRLFGLDPERDTPPSFSRFIDAVHPDDRAGLVTAIDSGFRDGLGAHPFEFRLKPVAEGEHRWILSLGRAITSRPDGRPLRMTGVSIDVTKRRREQEALAESEARLRLAFEAAKIFAWDWDVPSGRVTWMEGLERASGLGKGEFAGTVEAFRDLVHPDDAARVERAIGQALSGETEDYRAEFRMRRADGTWRWTTTRAVVIRDENAAPRRLVGVDHDISEQREAEMSLRASESRLRLAMEAAGLGAWEIDTNDGRSIRDAGMSSLLGFSPEHAEVASDRLFTRVHPDDVQRVRASYDVAVRDGVPFRSEFRIVRADGKERVVSSHGIMAAPGRLVGVAQDVTEARDAEALLRVSRERFEGVFESMVEFVGLLSADGQVMKANRAALEFAGVTREQVLGKKVWETEWFTRTPGAADQVARAVANAASGKFVRYQVELVGASRTAVVDFTLRPVRDEAGAVVLLVPEGRDISDLKAAEAALAVQEARFRAMLQALPLTVFSLDGSGLNDFINRHWHQYSGQSADAALGMGWADALHPDDRERTMSAKRAALASGQPYEIEHRLRGADGKYDWFLTRAVPGCGAAPEGGAGVRWFGGSTNVSKLVEARDASAKRAEMLEARVADHARSLADVAGELAAEISRRADIHARLLHAQKLEALGHLTGSVAHDFNNVLAAISGSYSVIRRRTDSERVLDVVGHGEFAVQRAGKLIKRLMSFVRREAPVSETIDVADALSAMQDLLGHAAGEFAGFELDVPGDVWPIVTDPQELGVALLNLVVNARDAMPGGGTIVVFARNLAEHAAPAELPTGKYVAIGVRDNGQGMPPAVLAKARDAFFTTKPQGKGTGFGLAMVHDFAKRSSGLLQIESVQGRGTTVKIVLPRAAMLTSKPERIADLKGISAASFKLHGSATILVVENDDQVRPLTAAWLTDLGYEVVQAASAEAAMALVRRLPTLDLLITDVAMPGDSGVELARRLRNEFVGLPVLFVTGSRTNLNLHGETVLLKPYADTALAKAVLKQLGRKVSIDPATAEPLLSRLRNQAMRELLLAWHAAKADGEGFPPMALIDATDFSLGAHAFAARLEKSDPPLFHYLFVGKALMDELARLRGIELVSAEAEGDEMIGTLDGVYRRCARTRAPIYQSAEYNFGDGPPFRFERLILPASDDGQEITHLVGVVLFGADFAENGR